MEPTLSVEVGHGVKKLRWQKASIRKRSFISVGTKIGQGITTKFTVFIAERMHLCLEVIKCLSYK